MGKIKNKFFHDKKKISRASKKIGKAPGSVNYLGSREKIESTIKIVDYTSDNVAHLLPTQYEEILTYKNPPSASWIDIVGINDEGFMERLGKDFGLNPLVLEDIVNPHQRPKIDDYGDYIFAVVKMLYLDADNNLVEEHVALVLFDHCVLSFQEMDEDVFGGVRDRIRNKSGRIRDRGVDYLFFALLDAIIDNYFLILENINSKIEALEEEVYNRPLPEVAKRIQELKKEVMRVRRVIFPVREMIGKLIDTECPLISKETKVFLRDVLDHSIEINESLQIYREMSMSLMEMYMSNMSNKMNEVMKVLTIMASIFIPLTFIVGVYGMNFDNIPELHTHNGYFVVWAVMIVIFIAMVFYFKKKHWL
tara:strand:- start:1838 stop:2929 length:1092 start_codon:yes stop_codon:yes gene_type:complete